jgi:hypothetical protein
MGMGMGMGVTSLDVWLGFVWVGLVDGCLWLCFVNPTLGFARVSLGLLTPPLALVSMNGSNCRNIIRCEAAREEIGGARSIKFSAYASLYLSPYKEKVKTEEMRKIYVSLAGGSLSSPNSYSFLFVNA